MIDDGIVTVRLVPADSGRNIRCDGCEEVVRVAQLLDAGGFGLPVRRLCPECFADYLEDIVNRQA